MSRATLRGLGLLGMVAWVPLGLGAKGCGTDSPSPDVNGSWDVTYGETLAVEISIGGAVYSGEVPADGGTLEIEHAGFMIPFDLDCSRPEVVCPAETFPAQVTASQREAEYPQRMWVSIPVQRCTGEMIAAAVDECGEGTLNPDCEDVCDGTIETVDQDTFGLINEAGDAFDLLLGGTVASNGVNCALLGISLAHADIVSSGTEATTTWRAEEFTNGSVVTAYAGGCLWGEYSETDEELHALVVAATVKLTTGFTATRTPTR